MSKINYQAIYEKNKHDWYAMTEEPQKYEALLAGHYSDSNHFVYELLQNAEDEKASKVVIEYYHDKLVFYHNGDPFDEDDVRGVSSMLMGTKNKDDASTIGKFGMGFKSVFKYTYQPEIYSDEDGFIIQNYLLPKEVKGNWDFHETKKILSYPNGDGRILPFVASDHLTKIVIPFKKKNAKGDLVAVSGKDVLDKLRGLTGEILLFLTYITDLYWINEETGGYSHITLKRDPQDQNLITCRIFGSNIDKKEEITRYLKYKDVFNLPEMKNAEVSVAYKINSQAKNINAVDDSPVWVYFPTRDDTELPFLIHGSFETAVSREKLMTPSDFNNSLFDRLGTLIADSMGDIGRRGLITQNFIRNIVLAAFQDEEENDTIPGLKDKITEVFRSKPLIPDMNGHERMASELRIPVPFTLADQANSVLWIDSFDGVGDFVAINAVRDSRFTEYYSWLRDDLGIVPFTLKDWAAKLCALPEKTISATDGTLDEVKEFYEFLNGYQENYFNNERTYSRAGAYEADIRNSLSSAWELLRKAPVILNAENCLVPAYKADNLQIYLSATSKYRKILNSSIVSNRFAKDFYTLFSDGFIIAEFDNYQFVKEKVIKKYVEGVEGRIGFANPDDFDEEYIEDLKQIFSLFDEVEDANDVRKMLQNAFIIKIVGDDPETSTFAYPGSVYVDKSDEGIDLPIYYHPVTVAYEDEEPDENGNTTYTDSDESDDFGVYHIDTQYYENHGISISQLKKLGLITSPVIEGERCGRGVGDDYWDALGEFCPWIEFDHLEDNLEYIETHENADLAKKKSAEILKLLLVSYKKLHGSIRRRQRSPYTKDEDAHILWRLNLYNWLFDKSDELHKPKELSRYDLDDEIYDDLLINKQAFEILGFVEKESDVKAETFEKVQALDRTDKKIMFRQLARELGYDVNSLDKATGSGETSDSYEDEGNEVFDPNAWMSDEFPQHRVRDMENLVAHVRQQFFFADPVKYEKVMRQIRTSKSTKAGRAYTTSMYVNESDVNICQMCKKPSRHVGAVEIANFGIEMPQLYLSLCPECARRYKEEFRDVSKDRFHNEMKRAILELDASEVEDDYEIKLSDDAIIHFTQTHIAEIKEILNLLDEYGVPGKQDEDIEIVAHRDGNINSGHINPSESKDVYKGDNDSGDRRHILVGRNPEVPSHREASSGGSHRDEPKHSESPTGSKNYGRFQIGDLVENKKYGRGSITDYDPVTKHLEVMFQSVGKKIYVYPMALDKGFLKVLPRDSQVSGTHDSQTGVGLAEFFEDAGFEVIDKRSSGGALWVIGTRHELEDITNKAKELFNAEGTFCNGGRAVGYRKSWFTKCKK